jgi:FAD:protein FMN transferase
MIMIKRFIAILIFLVTLFSSCIKKTPVFENTTGFIQGTTYNIIYDNRKNFNTSEVNTKIEQILHDFDMSLSLYLDSSILSRVNRNEDVKVDSFFKEVFIKSDSISKLTDGAFDVTVGPLVRAWGFGPDDHKNFREEKLDSMLNLIGMEKVAIADDHLIKKDPGILLDFNAIAQGYSVDVICSYFDRLGIKNYLVEIGGEVRAKGTKAGALWRIGIDRPEDLNMSPGQDLQAIIKISDQSVATSGNYRKFYVENGVKYSHTIDPRTGYPAKNKLLSATVITRECAVADGIATACMVMGKEGAIEFITSHPDLSGYLVFSDDSGNFKTWMSESLAKNVTETE